jgi:hypothetical protein
MDEETFKMVDSLINSNGDPSTKDAVEDILRIGADHDCLEEAAGVIGRRLGIQPQAIINWHTEVMKRRADELIQLRRAPGTCCPEPGCDNWTCDGCEYLHICPEDLRKMDYCPLPRKCPGCGSDCSTCELWLLPSRNNKKEVEPQNDR